jgi:hypothetical protein
MATRSHGLFRAVPHPAGDVAHGGCYIYGGGGPGVDTGVLIDFEGTLFLGNTAIRELAEVAGMSVNEEGAALERENAFLTQRCSELVDQIRDLNEQLDAVSVVLARAQKATK